MRHLQLLAAAFLVSPAAADPAPKSAAAAPAAFEKARAGRGGDEYVDRAMKVVIDVPPGFVLVAPKENSDAAYEFAFRHPKRRFEVRASLAALTETPARAEERAACGKKPGCWMADLDRPSEDWGAALLFNIGGGDGSFSQFPAAGVKKEFGADWGYVSDPFELAPGHSFNDEGYKLGRLVVLHRNGTGTVVRVALADDLETLEELDRPVFYGVRFEGARPPW